MTLDGAEVPRSNEAGRPFLIPLKGGGTANLVVRGRGYDYVPDVLVDGKEVEIARKLAPWEYVIAGLPLLLILVGGFVGAVVGFGAMALNQWLLRGSWPYPARVAGALGATVGAYVLVMLIVLALETILPNRTAS